ncbi:hypothetical protein CK203_035634 [Vitis vinifera]|uniref:Uncharacterized protein n=1 Tax=Vitis vinifera TaxID=29760 RepID=A0A438ICR3_VITVI|nr:hypothetical protein CK203_035634 [Vitis vinifera]
MSVPRERLTLTRAEEVLHSGPSANNDTVTPKEASKLINPEPGGSKNSMVKRALDILKESKKGDDDPKSMAVEGEGREEPIPSNSEHRIEASGERNNERDKDREREREMDMESERTKTRTLIEKGILIKNRNEMRLMRTERK